MDTTVKIILEPVEKACCKKLARGEVGMDWGDWALP